MFYDSELTAVVTGKSRGLFLEFARLFESEIGFRLLLGGSSHEQTNPSRPFYSLIRMGRRRIRLHRFHPNSGREPFLF